MIQEKKTVTADILGKHLGERIAFYRKKQNLTQALFAEMIGVDSLTISRFERGQTLPSLLRLFEMAEALGVGISQLLTEVSPLPSDIAKELSQSMEAMRPKDRELLTGIAELLKTRSEIPP